MQSLKLSRSQELRLIKLGIETLLNGIQTHTRPVKKPKGAHKWSAEQHKRFAATMKKKWADKKAAEK